MVRPARRRRGPDEGGAAGASRPTNSPGLSNFTTRPRPASKGVTSGPSSLPYSGMPASSRSVSRAGTPAGARAVPVQGLAGPEPERIASGQPGRDQAGSGAARSKRLPDRDRVLRTAEHLEAVLAGVPGPRYPGPVPRHLAERPGVIP